MAQAMKNGTSGNRIHTAEYILHTLVAYWNRNGIYSWCPGKIL